MRISDWSSDVCSSDLTKIYLLRLGLAPGPKNNRPRWDRAANIESRMSNPEAFPASSLPEEKRQPRQSRLVKAALACQRLGRFDVTLRNVSLTGIGGQGPHALQIGERMTVIMPGHEPMLGTVRWVAGTRLDRKSTRLNSSH